MSQPIPFGKYYLLERINVGGMAEVFKAKAFGVEGFERLVAVKRILPNIAEDEEFITMFIDEAKIAVQLQHANIAQIFDLGKVEDSYFIALEYVHGRDLRAIFDFVRKDGHKLPLAQACFIIMQVCEGLDYAHNKRDAQGRELNLVHRDVSPQNVLVGYEGEVKIVDFGIAKAAGKASKTQAGILKGKFGYMSPEQVRGLPVDRRSDIFALGIVLYELLTAERLFVGESDFSTLEKVRNVEILPPSSFNKKVPQELERIVLKALAKDVDDRYQNAIDLHDDLQAFLYSVGEFYSRKDLATWMKKTFFQELADENAKNAQFEKFEEPTPAPMVGSSRGGTNAKRSAGSVSRAAPARSDARPRGEPAVKSKAPGLDWDEEEMETQIFDKAPDIEVSGPGTREDDNELSSGDILLSDEQEGDDKTAIAPPPELLENPADARLSGGPARSGPPQGLGAFRQTGNLAAMAGAQPRSFTPNGVPGPGGPPPGAAPFRQTLMGVGVQGLALPGSASQSGPFAPSPYGAPSGASSQGQPYPGQPYPGQPGSMAPQPLPAGYTGTHSAVPERQPFGFAQQGPPRRTLWAVVAGIAILVAAGAGYMMLNRVGKLQIVVTPADATIALDDQPLKGATPMTIQRKPGKYALAVSREGYLRKDQQIEIQPNQFERIEIQLEASPDTGFELTSDPSGMPVWMDGGPFTGKEAGAPQARTDFKAYPVIPGRHVIEIRGEGKHAGWTWRHEFYQEPGKTMKLHATLAPPAGAAVAPTTEPAKTPTQNAPTPPPPAAREKPPVAAKAPAPQPARKPPAPKRPAIAKAPKAAPAPRAPTAAAGSADCTVRIGAKPWAKVSIDGQAVGTTPIMDHKVSCGTHKITLENADLSVKKTETIVVKSGEVFRKVFPLIDLDE